MRKGRLQRTSPCYRGLFFSSPTRHQSRQPKSEGKHRTGLRNDVGFNVVKALCTVYCGAPGVVDVDPPNEGASGSLDAQEVSSCGICRDGCLSKKCVVDVVYPDLHGAPWGEEGHRVESDACLVARQNDHVKGINEEVSNNTLGRGSLKAWTEHCQSIGTSRVRIHWITTTEVALELQVPQDLSGLEVGVVGLGDDS